MLNSGEMDRRVRIDRRDDTTVDAFGQPITAWTEVCTVWAKKKTLGGSELYRAQQVTPTVQVEWIIRHRTDVDTACRLVEGGVAYDIVHVGELGRREGLRLVVKTPEDA